MKARSLGSSSVSSELRAEPLLKPMTTRSLMMETLQWLWLVSGQRGREDLLLQS